MQVEAAPALLERVLVLPSVPFADRTRRLPERPGLYFAIKDDLEVLYIGMSRKSIRQRWKTWHIVTVKAEQERVQNDIRIAFIVYRDIANLVADEKSIIRELRPTWNSMHVPGALERQQRVDAEACKWIDCEEHDHEKWPPREPPTESRPCVCIVHVSCAVRMYGRQQPPA